MSKFHYALLFALSCALGFLITRATHVPHPPALAPAITMEQLAGAYQRIRPFDLSVLEDFFVAKQPRALLYIYRSDCDACEAQWNELAKITQTMPLLAIAADDTPEAFAAALAGRARSISFVPYYVSPGRVLSLRTWLRDNRCRFTGALPFVALTDGKGGCIMAWQGLTAHTAIEGVAKFVASAPPTL